MHQPRAHVEAISMSIHGTQQGHPLRINPRKNAEPQKRVEGTRSVFELIAANPKDAEEAL